MVISDPKHPAKFSMPIVRAIAHALMAFGVEGLVVDPFAGTGRIAWLRDMGPWDTLGVELEPEWAAMHEDTVCGDSTDLVAVVSGARPGLTVAAVATSVGYANRMSDTLLTPGRKDYTYAGSHSGLGRRLAEANTCGYQWTGAGGKTYRRISRQVWAECAALTDVVVLNIKDHKRGGDWQGVPLWHANALGEQGFRLDSVREVGTRGSKHGTNKDHESGDVELVLGFKKGR